MHIGAIPSTLSRHVCIDFVNSRFDDYRGSGHVIDRLELEEWRRWFVARCGLGESQPLSAEDRVELVAFRRFLRGELERRRRPSPAALATLNGYLSRSARWPEVSVGRGDPALNTRWTRPGWASVMAVVAASFAELVVGGELGRVHVCANPDCTYMFFDESRTGSRRWCDVAVCGNLMRVRRHRGLAPQLT
ncbi:MAG TPA: CGNR zinc finger domain-containing protein [Candidatus Dormibacteraeota bacterium]